MRTISHRSVDGVYPPSGSYAHAIELRHVDRLVFVSGTMGLDPQGVPGETLEVQLDLIWANIRKILGSAGLSVDDVVRVTSYLREPDYAGANAEARVRALDGRPVPTTVIVAQTLESDWLVEVEVIAAA